MPALSEFLPAERADPRTIEAREGLGVAEFTRVLNLPSPEIHALAKAAFVAGDRKLHDRLLHLGWLRNRFLKREGR